MGTQAASTYRRDWGNECMARGTDYSRFKLDLGEYIKGGEMSAGWLIVCLLQICRKESTKSSKQLG